MPQQIRKREKEKLVNAEINANNAIYLLKTNKNIDKLCETKEVFSNYLAEILMSNIRELFPECCNLTTFEVQEFENITLFSKNN